MQSGPRAIRCTNNDRVGQNLKYRLIAYCDSCIQRLLVLSPVKLIRVLGGDNHPVRVFRDWDCFLPRLCVLSFRLGAAIAIDGRETRRNKNYEVQSLNDKNRLLSGCLSTKSLFLPWKTSRVCQFFGISIGFPFNSPDANRLCNDVAQGCPANTFNGICQLRYHLNRKTF